MIVQGSALHQLLGPLSGPAGVRSRPVLLAPHRPVEAIRHCSFIQKSPGTPGWLNCGAMVAHALQAAAGVAVETTAEASPAKKTAAPRKLTPVTEKRLGDCTAAGVCFYSYSQEHQELCVLMVRQKEKKGKDSWTFPGGKRTRNQKPSNRELVRETAAREVKEETHGVLPFSMVDPMLDLCPAHWCSMGKYVLFLVPLEGQWDLPERIAGVLAAGKPDPQALKVIGAAWVPLSRMLGLTQRDHEDLEEGTGHRMLPMIVKDPLKAWLNEVDEKCRQGGGRCDLAELSFSLPAAREGGRGPEAAVEDAEGGSDEEEEEGEGNGGAGTPARAKAKAAAGKAEVKGQGKDKKGAGGKVELPAWLVRPAGEGSVLWPQGVLLSSLPDDQQPVVTVLRAPQPLVWPPPPPPHAPQSGAGSAPQRWQNGKQGGREQDGQYQSNPQQRRHSYPGSNSWRPQRQHRSEGGGSSGDGSLQGQVSAGDEQQGHINQQPPRQHTPRHRRYSAPPDSSGVGRQWGDQEGGEQGPQERQQAGGWNQSSSQGEGRRLPQQQQQHNRWQQQSGKQQMQGKWQQSQEREQGREQGDGEYAGSRSSRGRVGAMRDP